MMKVALGSKLDLGGLSPAEEEDRDLFRFLFIQLSSDRVLRSNETRLSYFRVSSRARS